MREFRATAVTTASGIGFGLLTWVVAHVTTIAAFAHIHPGFVIHYHGWMGPLAVAAVMLTVTSIVGAGAALRRPAAGDPRLSVLSGALAPAVFVAVEFVEYLTGVHEAPPAALLLIGCLVHAAIGAAAPVLWAVCTGQTQLRAATFTAPRPTTAAAVRAATRMWTVADTYHHQSSRAPPSGRVSPVPVC